MKERKFEVRENKKQDIEKQQFLYGVKHKSLCLQDIQTLKHCVGEKSTNLFAIILRE